MDYFRPRTRDEALRLLEQVPGARCIAGGTDLMVRLRQQRGSRPPALVSLRHVEGLSGVSVDGNTVEIGAVTPLAEVMAHPLVRKRCPALAAAIATMGSVQIRNVATLGGNLANASPCADSAPPLLVHGARLRLEGPAGRREVPVEDWFTGPGRTLAAPSEIVTAIRIETAPPGARAVFLKKGRVRMDLAVASVAVLIETDGLRCRRARVAAGSVAPTPLRLRTVEALLEGAALGPALLAEVQAAARAAVTPITDVRAGAEYRREIVGVFVRRAIEQLVDGRKQ